VPKLGDLTVRILCPSIEEPSRQKMTGQKAVVKAGSFFSMFHIKLFQAIIESRACFLNKIRDLKKS
jgi:hypothetical protein